MVALHKAHGDERTKGSTDSSVQLDSSLGAWLCLASLGAWGIGKRCPIGKMNNGYFKARKLSCGFGELLKYSFLVEL